MRENRLTTVWTRLWSARHPVREDGARFCKERMKFVNMQYSKDQNKIVARVDDTFQGLMLCGLRGSIGDVTTPLLF